MMGGGDGDGAMHRNNNNSSKSPSGSMLVAFPILNILTLSSLNLNKVWGDNQHSFCKLTNLVVDNCGQLKYLFLPSFGWKLVNVF